MKETTTDPATSLGEQLAPLLEGLLYPSESDEPVVFLSIPCSRRGEISGWEFVELLGLEDAEDVAELTPERFWLPVVVDQDWYEAEEKERTARFVEIRRILEENLEDIQYFEVGEVEVGLYLLGHSGQSTMGIKTIAIRT